MLDVGEHSNFTLYCMHAGSLYGLVISMAMATAFYADSLSLDVPTGEFSTFIKEARSILRIASECICVHFCISAIHGSLTCTSRTSFGFMSLGPGLT